MALTPSVEIEERREEGGSGEERWRSGKGVGEGRREERRGEEREKKRSKNN